MPFDVSRLTSVIMSSYTLPGGTPLHLHLHSAQQKCCVAALGGPVAGHRRCRLSSGTKCFARHSSVSRRRNVQLCPASYQVYTRTLGRQSAALSASVPLTLVRLRCRPRQKCPQHFINMLHLSNVQWRGHMQACLICMSKPLPECPQRGISGN